MDFEVRGTIKHTIRMFRIMGAPIALFDCNNFYASCERLFQPKLRGKPIVVLSNNDGCVIARSNEVKALGVKMGEPWHPMRGRYAKDGIIVRLELGDYTLYGDLSNRVMQILAEFSPAFEIYSIDEAFLGAWKEFDQRLEPHCRQMRARVLQWTGIPVSVGVGPTKTLAKIAEPHGEEEPCQRRCLHSAHSGRPGRRT